MKTKRIRIYLTTWRKLRHAFPGMRGETNAEYLERYRKAVELEVEG